MLPTANAARQVKIHHAHEFVTTASNTANVLSRIMTVTPPNGVWLKIERLFLPVIKLMTSAGVQISGESKVYIGKKRPGDATVTWLPGVFTLQSFADLTTAQQRDVNNRPTLLQDLGSGVAVREQEELVIGLESADVVDWTKTGTAFEFAASVVNL